MATITLAVTVSNPGSGNKYYIDGVLQATVSMTPGNTYKFDQADNSNSGHPLRLSTTSNGSHNSGSEYTTGVTTSGTPGSSGAYTQIEVTALTVQTLYYYCTAHSGMGGTINVGNSSTKNLKEMSGFAIENLSADPVPYAQALIDDPYAGSWSSGGNLNQSRYSIAGAGTQTAGLAFGGYSAPSRRNETEEYNGTAWSEQNNLNMQRNELTGAGSQTSALAAGGYYTSATNDAETYNGTSWTEISNLNAGRDGLGSTAVGSVNTAVIVVGGSPASNLVESWNGTSWSEVNELNTGRDVGVSSGTSTSGITMGGNTPSKTGKTETWNGSTWTEVSDLNTARARLGAAGTSSTSSLVFGGETAPGAVSALSESWNGSAWTETNDLGTARYGLTGGGGGSPNTTSLASGGYTSSPSGVANTEEWSFSGLPPSTPAADYSDAIVGQMYYNSTSGSFKAIKSGGAPVGTWSSGGNTNTGRRYLGGVGSKTAGLIFGGANPGNIANTESYNGTAWSEVNDLNAVQIAMGTAGTSTSGMSALGATSPNTRVEDWNGTCWSSNPHSLNSGRQFAAGDGPSNDSALMVGGEPSPNGAKTETYNGSTWTETADLNSGRNQLAGVGTVTAFLAVGGYPSEQDAELWNGTSWTEVSDLSNGGPGISASGDSELAIAFAGHPSFIATNEAWNGTAWTEVGDLATGRNFAGSSNNTGNTEAFIASGESGPGYLTSSEEWTAADFEIKTLTTS
jgi:hypothetical protein